MESLGQDSENHNQRLASPSHIRDKSIAYLATLTSVVCLSAFGNTTQAESLTSLDEYGPDPVIPASRHNSEKRPHGSCNDDGCSVTLNLKPHETRHWESQKKYRPSDIYSVGAKVDGGRNLSGEIFGPYDCAARLYGDGVAISIDTCNKPRTHIETWFASVAQKKVRVHLNIETK